MREMFGWWWDQLVEKSGCEGIEVYRNSLLVWDDRQSISIQFFRHQDHQETHLNLKKKIDCTVHNWWRLKSYRLMMMMRMKLMILIINRFLITFYLHLHLLPSLVSLQPLIKIYHQDYRTTRIYHSIKGQSPELRLLSYLSFRYSSSFFESPSDLLLLLHLNLIQLHIEDLQLVYLHQSLNPNLNFKHHYY